MISYDVNHRPALWTPELPWRVIRQSIEDYADIVMISEEEMGLLEWGGSVGDPERVLRRQTRAGRLRGHPGMESR